MTRPERKRNFEQNLMVTRTEGKGLKQGWLNGEIAREIEKIAGLQVTRPERKINFKQNCLDGDKDRGKEV